MSDQDRLHDPHDPHGRRGYDPNQPRVPAGQSTGGQWTDTDGNNVGADPARKFVRDTSGEEAWNFFFNTFRPDGSLAEQVVFNRDRSRIVSEFNAPGGAEDWDERHTVVTPDGGKFTFETSGDTQTIYDGDGRPISAAVWTNNGPEPLSLVQPAFWPGAAAGAGVAAGKGAVTEFGLAAAAAALFTWLSSRNGPDGTAIFAFKAVEYRKVGPENKPDAEWVGRLTRDQVNKVCGQLKDVQGRTDDAVAEVRKVGGYKNAADFGTKVHKMIADGIKAVGDDNYRAEVSLIKSKLEQDADYGELDSVRIDALENRPETSTVCVYDPKTGKRGFRPSRMTELAQTVLRVYPKTQRIFVIEVRPGQR